MDAEEQKDRELRMKQEMAKAREAFSNTFGSKDGQWVLAFIKKQIGFDDRVFHPVNRGDHHAYDPLTAAARDGARAVVILINDMLKPQPDEKPKPKIKRK